MALISPDLTTHTLDRAVDDMPWMEVNNCSSHSNPGSEQGDMIETERRRRWRRQMRGGYDQQQVLPNSYSQANKGKRTLRYRTDPVLDEELQSKCSEQGTLMQSVVGRICGVY